MGQSNPEDLGNGGTIDGNIVITGDLQVDGGGSLSFDEIITGTQQIKVTDTSALLVEKADGTDVFIVDTTNAKVTVSHNDNISLVIDSTSATRNGILSFTNSADSKNFEFKHNSFDPEAGTNQLEINSTDTANIMVFNLDGKIGLGTANPSTLLNLESATSTAITAENTGNSAVALNLDANRSGADQGLGNINFKWNGTSVAQISGASGADTTNKDDGQIQFSTMSGGSSSVNMTLDKDGNLGIGTDSPDYKLKVEESTNGADCAIAIRALNDGGAGRTALLKVDPDAQTYSFGGTASLIADISNERIGIGTGANIDAKLHIEETVSSTDVAVKLEATNDIYLQFAPANTLKWAITADYPATNDFNIYNYPNNRNDFTIAGATGNATFAGNVGIGTTSPASRLHLYNLGDATNNEFIMETDSSSGGATGNQYLTMKREDTNRANEIKFVTQAHSGSAVHKFSLGQTDSDETGVDGTEFYIGRASGGANPDFIITSAGDVQLQERLTFSGTNNTSAAATINLNSNNYLYIAGGTAGLIIGDDALATAIQFNDASSMAFDIGGGTRAKLDSNSRISLSNNDSGGTGGSDSTSGNSLFGHLAGASIASGDLDNTYIGHKSGNASTARRNTGLGANSLKTIVGGEENVAIGYLASTAFGASETGNVAVGANAMGSADEGSNAHINYNIAIGTNALIAGDFGSASVDLIDNIAIGAGAMQSTSTYAHTGTVAIGRDSLKVAQGDANVAVGYKSLSVCATGSKNTAIGYQSLDALTGGSGENTAVGYGSLGALQTGAFNTAIGNDSLSAMNGSESNNVAVGRSAGYNIDGGENNVFVGRSTQGSSATAANQNVFGYHAAGVADNSVTLGNADVTAVYMAEDSGATVYCAGVNFPDTQVASADANTLDDYEEGTFTPSLGGNTSYNAQVGNYTKIGRKVTCIISLNINAIGTGNTHTISGLPFASIDATEASGCVGFFSGSANTVSTINPSVNNDASTITLCSVGGSGATATATSTAIFANSTSIRINVTYFTD